MYSLSRKKALHTSRYAKKLEKRRRVLYWLLLILLLSVLAGLITLLRSSYLQIDSVTVSGASAEKNAKIKTQIEKVATESYVYLIPKNTVLTFPLQQFTENLLKEEPSFASVSMETKGLKSLNVAVTLREPVAISCPVESVGENPSSEVNPYAPDSQLQTNAASSTILTSMDQIDESSSGSVEANIPPCKFLDKNAFAYAPAPNYSPGVYVTFYATDTVAVGEHIKDASVYQGFLQLNKDLKPYSGIVESVLFEPGEEYEVRAIFNQASSTVRIFFNSRIPLNLSIDRVIKLIDSKYLAHKTGPDKTPGLWQLEYIDGRYGPTVYYKYK